MDEFSKVKKDRIRVGYLSYDLRRHAVGIQAQNIFKFHDRTKFEVFAYSTYNKDLSKDTLHKKIKRNVEHFVDVSALGNQDIAKKYQFDI